MIMIKQFEFNPFGENTYVLSDETREAVVVDCGCMMARERSALSDYITEHGLTPVRLLCTHLHFDHIIGNAFIRDIEHFQRAIDLSPVPVGVIYFDLNGLKPVNDQQGHRAGDRLLMRLADAISLFFRKQEIYRTGGDEFVVLCLDMPEAQFKERLAERLSKVLDHIDSVSSLSVSVGHAWDEGSGLSLQKVIAAADAKMYEEKKAYYKGRHRAR